MKPSLDAPALVDAIRMLLDMQHCGHINGDMVLGEIELLLGLPDPARREPYRTVVFHSSAFAR